MAATGREYIAYARQRSSNGCYSKAVDFYLMAFEKNEELKPLYEAEFRSNIIKLNELLAHGDKVEEIFSNFGRAINLFPENILLLNEIGKYLYKYGYYEEAWNQFQTALTLDAGFVNAEKNLNSMKNYMVNRWHFRMLNDKTRNQGYQAALQEMIEPYRTTVLDVGTGTGVLAMYASQFRPFSIAACDSSEIMTVLTDCVLFDNQTTMAIVVVNKMSTSLDCSEIGGKQSLLVTEIFDAGLFGEHILQTLNHAWENLLTNTAQVIPHSAEFFILGAYSERLNAKYQLCSKIKAFLNISCLHVHIANGGETYDCEDVHLYDDMKYMTDAVSLIKVDFTDVDDIQEKLEQAEPYVVKLKALENGKINSVLGFFNLYLTTNITITTDPRLKTRANAWQQAVFYDSVPQNVKQNETPNFSFLINSGKIKITDLNCNIMRVSAETLRFLNDNDYMKMIKNCIPMAYVYLGQLNDISDVNVIDLCPFPVFGLLMLKRGIKSLYCYGRNLCDLKFIEHVFVANDVDMARVTMIIGGDLSASNLEGKKFHAIFCNILELGGDIDVGMKDMAQNLKNVHLKSGGLFMPATVTLMAQIVSSNVLNINNRVFDENVGYKVSYHINKYQVSQNFCLDLVNLEYTPLSDVIDLGNCDHLSSDVINVPIKIDGEANAILVWYNIELIESLEQISTKRPYSFIDGTAFLSDPSIPMQEGDTANILRCVDSDGSFKLVLDIEN